MLCKLTLDAFKMNLSIFPRPPPVVVKNLCANAGGIEDADLIPGLERSSGEGQGNPSSNLAWRIPWTEEPGRLQAMGSRRVIHD